MALECIYELSDSTTNVVVSKGFVARLEDRVKLLEDRVDQHEHLLKTPALDQNAFPPRHSSSEPTHLAAMQLQELPPEESLTDGMAITFVDEEDSGFFGLSSNIAFVRGMMRTMTSTSNATELRTPTMSEPLYMDNTVVNASRPPSPPGQKKAEWGATSLYWLPSETETRKLLRQFFSNTGLLFPFLHEASFLETYDKMLRERYSKVQRTWLGLLNVVLALTVSTSGGGADTASIRTRESEQYYYRASELCKSQMLRGTSLEIVQYLLLMTQYLQGTQKSVQTWATHGLAVKAAMSLGLHSLEASRNFSPVHQEMRKRTWYGCVILDRSLSVTFGRPSAIPEDYVKLPPPVPLEGEHVEAHASKAVSIPFFRATIALYKVQYKVLSSLYGQNLGCDQPLSEAEIASQVFQTEQELQQWQNSLALPLCLRTTYTLSLVEDWILERFRVILTLRYLNLQVLLHRPFLSIALELRAKEQNQTRATMSSAEHLAAGCIRTCVHSAEETISLIHTITSAARGHVLLGAWWFSLYFTFGSALVIFGSLLVIPKTDSSIMSFTTQIQRGQAYLQKATEAIQVLDAGNPITFRCTKFLRQLLHLLEQWISDLSAAQNAGSDTFPLTLDAMQYDASQLPGFGGQGLDLSAHQITGEQDPFMNGGLEGFGYSDLELGQFFLPDDLNRWQTRRPDAR